MQLISSWQTKLSNEFNQPYFQTLREFINVEYHSQMVYPPYECILNALNQCSFEELKVVILGQDPYHGPGQAQGLCFSVNDGIPLPPSLKNIFREVKADLGKDIPQSGNLERWAKQGVLLLNAILTVRAHQPTSHQNKGWEQFTDAIIKMISLEKNHVVFLLWGKYAQDKGKIVDVRKHLVLTSAHPSPLSAKKFFGNRHFSQTNAYLQATHQIPIDW